MILGRPTAFWKVINTNRYTAAPGQVLNTERGRVDVNESGYTDIPSIKR